MCHARDAHRNDANRSLDTHDQLMAYPPCHLGYGSRCGGHAYHDQHGRRVVNLEQNSTSFSEDLLTCNNETTSGVELWVGFFATHIPLRHV
ncbi:hypothetical protein L210DRAFT_3549069 [Boletus edulis BED1]|uniref:Uncharacterized protein n=1 Tax=Boletus edulis BED1 TaxID=1328754 RepID=A0AAD4GCE1_BOLED|nr:hypothetical protein L210DRAFT_3564159 [Boletus edulis BED1]KAF8436225.1 hypothetical protein L210DRAFT_3549069 [Boletus edulis BED1]